MPISKVNKTTGDLNEVAGSPTIASAIGYDNTQSGLPASNVQQAIDLAPRIFYGSQAAWDELPLATKKQYDYAAFDEDDGEEITLFITDSYGDTDTDSEGITEFLPEAFANALGNLTLGTNYFKANEDGAGFIQQGVTTHKTFIDLLDDLANSSDFDNKDVKNIVVAGGWNDYGKTLAAMQTAIDTFAADAKTKFPNALVSLAMVAWTDTTSVRLGLVRVVLPAYKGCTASNVRYLDGTEYCNHIYTNFSSDHCHPNKAGYIELGRKLAIAYKQGSINPQYITSKYAEQEAAWWKYHNNAGNVQLLHTCVVETATAFEISGAHFDVYMWEGVGDIPPKGSFVKIGEVSDWMSNFMRHNSGSGDKGWFPVTCTIYYSDDTWDTVPCVFILSGTDIMIYRQGVEPSGDTRTATGLNAGAFRIVVPKLCC